MQSLYFLPNFLNFLFTCVYCGSVCMYYRILEVKQEMFKLEMLEFHYFDDLLTDMKLTPVR